MVNSDHKIGKTSKITAMSGLTHQYLGSFTMVASRSMIKTSYSDKDYMCFQVILRLIPHTKYLTDNMEKKRKRPS